MHSDSLTWKFVEDEENGLSGGPLSTSMLASRRAIDQPVIYIHSFHFRSGPANALHQ